MAIRNLVTVYRKVENTIVSVLLTLLIVLAFAQVAGRLFLNAGVPDGDTIIYHLVLWVGLLGAILATREKEHITIDIVSRFVSGRIRTFCMTITSLFTLSVCSILTWISVRFVMDEKLYNDDLIIGIPIWIFQLIIPVCFGIMSFRYIIQTVAHIVKLVSRNHPESQAQP